jgi:sec-independent protein translocase protein TatB
VFGLSLGEIMLLFIVGMVVVGPKNLPSLMRTAGQWIGKLRRMSSDLRNQSGIDDLIRQEGLEREIQELRSLSRMNINTLITPSLTSVATSPSRPALKTPEVTRAEPLREREYPLIGCDARGALPDDAVVYAPHDDAAEPSASASALPGSVEGRALAEPMPLPASGERWEGLPP